MSTLGKALFIAAEVHQNQEDRYGIPYILHPVRVMQRVESEKEKTVAILHDVIEDSQWSLQMLREAGFSEEIVRAVDGVTKREDEDYHNYISRTSQDPLATTVKMADLEDNMDLTRVVRFSEEVAKRLARYHEAWLRLKKFSRNMKKQQ